MSRPPRVGAAIVGAGFVGPHHADAVQRGGIGQVLAIVDTDFELTSRRAAGLGIPEATTDLVHVLADPAIQVLHICTRNETHVDLALRALEAGKHVVVEKPMAPDTASARRLVDAARSAKRHAAVSFTYRGYPMVRRARSLVAGGDLGNVRMVHGGYLQDWLSEPDDYNWRVEASGDGGSQAIADIGTHWFNVAEYVTGTRVVAVVADLRTFVPTRLRPREQVGTYQRGGGVRDEVAVTAEDSALILLRFADGSIGSCVISQVSPGRKNKLMLEVAGSRSTLAWDHETSPGSLWVGSREESRLVSGLAAPPRGIGADPLPIGLPEGWGEALRDLFIPFYTAIVQGSPVSLEEAPYPSFLDGLRAAIFVEAALESGRSGLWVTLPDA